MFQKVMDTILQGVPNSSLTMSSAVLQCQLFWALNAEDLHDSEDKVEAL